MSTIPPSSSTAEAIPTSGPEYFAGMEEMLVYFEGVTAAVVNYSPADTNAIRNELQMLGARSARGTPRTVPTS